MSESSINSALELAAKARQARLDLETQLNTGATVLADVFELGKSDPLVGRLKVMPLLDALPDVKKIDVRRFLESANISESVKLDQMTLDEAQLLVKEFG